MREVENQLEELDVRVAVVTFEAGPLAQAYVKETDLKWPLLVDDDRLLYKAYGMDHGSWWNIYGPPAWVIYIKLLAKGRKLTKYRKSDFPPLGDDVLIDPQGIVRLHYIGNGPADRPTVGTLIAMVKGA